MRLPRHVIALPRMVGVTVVCALATFFVVASVKHASVASNDFQWSGARLLLHGIDPYQALFAGHRSLFAMTQIPVYAPLLYVLLLPLAALPLALAQPVWAAINLVMFSASSVLVARAAGLRAIGTIVFTALFFCGEPYVVAEGSGQQTALALFCAVLAARLRTQAGAGAALGIMAVKYSFAPVAVLALLQRRWRVLVVALSLELGGLLVFTVVAGSGVISTATAPLRAAFVYQARGAGAVMSLVRALGGESWLGMALGVTFGVVVTFYARRRLRGGDWLGGLACASLIALMVFPHLVYDYAFLLPVAAAALRLRVGPRAVVLGVVALIWYSWLVGHVPLKPYCLPGLVETLLLSLGALVVLVHARPSPIASCPASSQTSFQRRLIHRNRSADVTWSVR